MMRFPGGDNSNMLKKITPTVPEEMIQFDYIMFFKRVGEQPPTFSFLFSPQAT